MAEGLTGDFAKLAALIEGLGELGDTARAEAAPVLRLELLSLVADQFRRGVDPFGVPWAPLKEREGQPLRNTGTLMNSFACTDRFPLTLGTNVPYASYHQDGTTRMVSRPMLPPDGVLPPTWATALTDATELVLKAITDGLPS